MKIWTAALLLSLSLPAWPQGESLGRLFFTPQQRATLERQRLTGVHGSSIAERHASSYTLNGEVRRSSGHNTRWVNNSALTGADAPRGIIGDTYHPTVGDRDRLLGDGRIIIHKVPQQP